MTLEVVFLGIHEAGQEVYNWLERQPNVEIKALVTEKEELDFVREIEPDLVVSMGFEHKVPKEIIEIPEKGIVNIHPSFLPYNRGAHPYIWTLVEGAPAGVSAHYMVPEIDEGPVIERREVMVTPDDTAKDLYKRLERAQVELFKDIWPEVRDGDAETEQQDLEKGSVHYEKEVEDLRRIDPDEESTAGEFIDRLRALTFPPHKTAYFEKDGQKYFVEIDITPEREMEDE